MDKIIDFETRLPRTEPVPVNRRRVYEDGASLYFETEPRIANRSDALALLDALLDADFVENGNRALEALRNAIEREAV
jgi:hypothetical protein